jgi:hypothetical protein
VTTRTRSGTSGGVLVKVIVVMMVGAAVAWLVGGRGGGGLITEPDPTGCWRAVTFSTNWSEKDGRARTVKWGPTADLQLADNVSAPWQETEKIKCNTPVMIHVSFSHDVDPGELLCAITANNRVWEPDGSPRSRGSARTCFEQVHVT